MKGVSHQKKNYLECFHLVLARWLPDLRRAAGLCGGCLALPIWQNSGAASPEMFGSPSLTEVWCSLSGINVVLESPLWQMSYSSSLADV